MASFFLVLFTMPLGHAMMMIMDRVMTPTAVHYAGFMMGFVGLFIVVAGVFAKDDTRQTLCGLFGGLLFWTGWVEFLFQYYANRYGTQPEVVDGVVVTRPEYLILPATFGLWAMVMTLYIFCTRTGCNFINWWQRLFFGKHKAEIVVRPMTRHVSIVTFMELNMILWTSYLALMFCYDPHFIGDHSPVTFLVGFGCFVGSIFMFRKELRLASWGANIRHGHCNGYRLLDPCRDSWTSQFLHRDMDTTRTLQGSDDSYSCSLPCAISQSYSSGCTK